MEHSESQRGFISIEFLVAVGFSLIFLVFMVNFVAYQFGKGMVRAAVNEGARAGSFASGNDNTCIAKVNQILGDFFLSPMGENLDPVDCHPAIDSSGQEVQVARITGTFPSWFPQFGLGDFPVDITASAAKERFPS